jgi:high affinity Mn2+ porin
MDRRQALGRQMRNPGRKERSFPREARRITHALAVFLSLALAGCTLVQPFVALPQDFTKTPEAASTTKQVPAEPGSEGAAKSKESPSVKAETPRPRTICQAIHAYCDRLRSPKPPAENEAKASSDSANGKEKKAGSEKLTNGKDQQMGEKSPPANGSPESAKNGDKGNGQAEPEANGKKDKEAKDKENNGDKEGAWYSAHAQATMDTQAHSNFSPPYTGPNSLLPNEPAATSLTATLFLAARLWECGCYSGELVFNPELAGGRGFSDVNGLGGFTNGDITRVGVVEPTPYFARIFVRQIWGLGGEQEKVEDEANQIAGKRDVDRFTLSVGKFAFTDIVDNNAYSHDPRTQMQNWSLMYNGAWDYPANVRGYSYGIAMEYNEKAWALRYGVMAEPANANSAALDPHFTKAFGQALEWEGRFKLYDHPGRVRLMAYLNRANMGDYLEALTAMPVDPDVTQTRAYRFKYGFGLNFEQELTRDLGLWGRLGWSDGHTETWAFTPIDRTVALGLLLKGRCWARPDDRVGLGAAANGLAKDHRDYLAAGGLDFSIGDGRLSYGLEDIIEVYYRVSVIKGIYVTADFQQIFNPAYNRDRGPVSVGALLVHIEL